jgi:hypothetical protein
MKNTGATTWTSAGGYKLFQSRGLEFWIPGEDAVTGSVAPNATHTFAFDLRTDAPDQRGLTPCFFRMFILGSYFGAENGRDIDITGPKTTSGSEAAAMAAEEPPPKAIDPTPWIAGATDGGTTRLGLGDLKLRAGEAVVFDYGYVHEAPRAIDVVFKFVYDPAVLEPLAFQPGGGATGLAVEAGAGAPGEYWVRLTGTVPTGTGLVAGFPFRLSPDARVPKELGTLTIYYP